VRSQKQFILSAARAPMSLALPLHRLTATVGGLTMLPGIRGPLLGVLALLLAVPPAPASAQSVESFYKGKRITMLVGSAVGGGYDAYARFVGRHLGRFIPGNPTFVVQNMPGAAGAVAASNLYNVSARDGTVMEMFQRETLIAPLLESRNIENRYEARKFNWLGSLNSETGVIVVRGSTSHKSFDDLLTKEIIAGSTGPSSDFLTIAMNRILKTKFKLVGGYRSSVEVYLAIERGEVEARVSNGWSGDKNILAPWVRDGKARLLVALTLKKSRELPDLPLITDFARDPADRQVLELILFGGLWGRPFALPPDVPKDRVAALRKAFVEMTNDAEFLAEAQKLDLDLDVMTGEQIEEVLAKAYASPPEVIEAARRAIGGN
jgi:tripartite-type tricarboxylate transporter receptor subunit TctC